MFLNNRMTLQILLTILSLNFISCGHEDASLQGTWILHQGPYMRTALKFDGKHCRAITYHPETGSSASPQMIPFSYQRKTSRITFFGPGISLEADVYFFRESGERRFRLLHIKASANETKTPFDSEGFDLLEKLTRDVDLKPVFREVPNWVMTDKKGLPKGDHPLDGYWTQRLGRGESAAGFHIEMKNGRKGRMISPEKFWEKALSSGSIEIDDSHLPFRIYWPEDNKKAVFEFPDHNLLRLAMVETDDWPNRVDGGILFRRKPKACSEPFIEADRLSEAFGLRIQITRPDYYKRLPELHIQPISDDDCSASMNFLSMLDQELKKYPEAGSLVDVISPAKKITYNEATQDGLVQFHRFKTFLFMDLNAAEPAFMFHHYALQLLDARGPGQDRAQKKMDWLTLNRRMGLGGDYFLSQTTSTDNCFTTDQPHRGLVSRLAGSSFINDRSQVFAALMTDGGPCGSPESLIADEAIVEKIYLLFFQYRNILEPVIARWISDYGLPDLRGKPQWKPPPMPQAPESKPPIEETTEPETTVATLEIGSNQANDKVFIDKKFYGSTPLELNLDPGQYEVRVEKPGYDSYIQTITLQEGKTRALKANLTPIKPAEVQESKPEPAPVNTRRESKPKGAPLVGNLEVHIQSSVMRKAKWSQIIITIDGQATSIDYDGESPFSDKRKLDVGEHQFKIESNAYYGNPPLTIDIRPGQTLKIECEIKGMNGRKLTIKVDGQTIHDGLKLEKK